MSVVVFAKRSNQHFGAVVFAVIVMTSTANLMSSYGQMNYSVKMPDEEVFVTRTPVLEHRIAIEQIKNPYWHEKHGQGDEARLFWDRDTWDRNLSEWALYGYNGIFYYVEPWQETQWSDLLIRNEEFPEARCLTSKQSERVIEHIKWIFKRAHELGMKNYLFTYQIVTTPAFAKAHGMDKDMPESDTVDWRHNMKGTMGAQYGVRNELTRAYTEAAIIELFQTYDDLDGLNGGMAESLPGKKSTWFEEAVVPGLKRSGRNPVFQMMNWMLPLDEFMEDVVSRHVYNNLWVSVMHNGETITDAKPYPMVFNWAEKPGLPTIIEIVHHNFEGRFPHNSPRLAYEMVQEYKRVPNCVGFLSWCLRYDPNPLFRAALGYYSSKDVPYSDAPWVDALEERYGDRLAAQHFLNAYNASAYITPELSAIAWCPMDRGISRQLALPYWWWSEEDARWSYLVSPVRGAMLLPVRHYAKVVAQFGDMYKDNNGSDYSKNYDHPGAQEIIWGFGSYPTTPEAHMRNIRKLGEESLREAEAAVKTVKKNVDEAATVYNYMKAYKLLTDYYERKVLAAISALIYSFNGNGADRADALRLSAEAVDLYETAIDFIWENIDGKEGELKGKWGREFTMPELIEQEKKERDRIPEIFKWPSE